MPDLQPLVQNFPLVDKDGNYTVVFKRFLDSLLQRVGGILGGIYTNVVPQSGSALWNLDASPNIVIKLTTPTTLITTVNQVAGAPPYRITLVQDAVGGRLVTWGPEFKWPSGVTPTLSTGANAVDIIAFDSDGTNMRYNYSVKDIR